MLSKKLLSGLVLASFLLGVAPVMATTPSSTTVDPTIVQCVRTAVSVREQALAAGIADYTRSITTAYSDRATALDTAYSQSTNSAIKSGVSSAWKTFNTFVKSVKNKWSKTRTEAWSTFRASAKACKAPSSLSDSGNSGSEI